MRFYLLTALIALLQVATAVGQPLFEAAAEDNSKQAERLLKAGASVEQRNEFGHTPLFTAAENNALGVAGLLLENGANVNAQASGSSTAIFNDMRTPLFEAVIFGYKDMAELLLKHGADVNASTIMGQTPLFYAVINESPDMVEFLIDKGANVNAVDSTGNTPLHELAMTFPDEWKQSTEAKILLQHGADPTLKNLEGLTPEQAGTKSSDEMKREDESYF